MPVPLSESGEAVQLAPRFGLDQHAGGQRLQELGVGLAGTGKTDTVGRHAGIQRLGQLARRGHVEAVDHGREESHQRRHRIGLDRIVQIEARRQVGAQRRFGVGGLHCNPKKIGKKVSIVRRHERGPGSSVVAG